MIPMIAGRRRSHTPLPGYQPPVVAAGGANIGGPISNHLEVQCANAKLSSTQSSIELNQLLASNTGSDMPSDHGKKKPPESVSARNSFDDVRPTLMNLNIGGSSYKISMKAAHCRCPTGRLADLVNSEHSSRLLKVDGYFEQTGEYFFARSSQLFECVYRFYCTGHLHRPLDVCLTEYKAELAFWNLDDSLFSTCCFPLSLTDEDDDDKEDDFTTVRYGAQRRAAWKFCEGSGTVGSNIFSFLSIMFVLLSVGGLVVSSIPELQVPSKRALRMASNYSNETVIDYLKELEPHPWFAHLETVCIIWFTMEYALRFTISPVKWQFCKGALNIVDLLAIVPYYLELTLELLGIDTESLRDLKGALLVIRILRVLRVVRIFKLGRYSAGMRTFALTLRSSAKQLGMMAMVMTTGVIFFSTMVYFLEKDAPNTPFSSIPAAFWWCIVTMTTVGYGDVVPVTLGGKLVASGAIVSGVLVLALPITIIVDNFMKVSGKYDKTETESDSEQKKKNSKFGGGWPRLNLK